MKARITLVILIALASFAAQADNSKLRELDPLKGTWTCKGTAFAMGDTPEHPVAATITGSWILGGQWLEVHYTETKTAKNPKPFAVRAFFGYDSELKKLVLGSIESDGGYSTENSDGWQGNSIVFVGPNHMGGMTMNGRDTWTKTGKNTMAYKFELEDKGKWATAIEETCSK